MAEVDCIGSKVCSKCGVLKELSAYGVGRACCRECYNDVRKKHYAANKEIKNEKRRAYESRPDVRQRRYERRMLPENWEREKAAVARYRLKPEAQQKIKAQRKLYESTPENRAKIVWYAAESRARKCGLSFNLTHEWAKEKVLAGRCEVSGIPFIFSTDKNKTRRNPFAPSIDQIDAGKGYTVENCRMVLAAVNLALCDWGLEQFLEIAEKTLEFQKRGAYGKNEPCV